MENVWACNLVAQFFFLFHFCYCLCKQPTGKFPSNLRCDLLSTRKKKQRTPAAAMMIPGTMNDRPHADDTYTPAMREPRMFPTEVWEFQMPMMNPRLHQRAILEDWSQCEISLLIHYHLKVCVFLYIFFTHQGCIHVIINTLKTVIFIKYSYN